jgi:2-octaprenyl-6-methoxyphenol hydroxylase
VALIDTNNPADYARASFDPRASAVTAMSRAMLEALGVWPKLAGAAQPMREIKVTDSRLGAGARPALLNFGEALGGPRASADMVENHLIYGALWQSVSGCPAIEPHIGHRVEAIETRGPAAKIRLGNGGTIAATLVVAADGRNSFIRKAAGIQTVGWSYPQHGIVTTVSHERDHCGIAEEHFLPAGPFAILPLTGNRSSLVWTEASEIAGEIVAGPDKQFQAELERRFGGHLGKVVPVGPRTSFALSMFLARSYAADRVALAGDAAHIVHPIAGLGFNLGLRDAAELSDTVVDNVRLGQDIGSMAVLGSYERGRRFDNVLVALATDGLNRLFSNDNSAVRAIRDLGLTMVDRVDPLKRFFMAQASGRNADLPSLMRSHPG